MSRLDPQLGLNRTGLQTSPILSVAMLDSVDHFPWDEMLKNPENPEHIRLEAMHEAEAVGSIPLPLTIKGAVKTGYGKLKGAKPEILVDRLGERLAFERSGFRLYNALLRKCRGANDRHSAVNLERLQEIAEAELDHMLMLKMLMEDIGADPTATTPGADAVSMTSMGLMQLLNDPRSSVAQCLEAMLMAELADADAWGLLIEIAAQMGEDIMFAHFQKAHAEEEQHVQDIRRMLKAVITGSLH